MSLETVVAGAVAAGGASALGAVVNGWWNKRKLGAEATKVITEAASEVVRDLQSTLKESREDNARLRGEAAVLRGDRDRDHLLIREMRRELDDLRHELKARDELHLACQEFANELIARLEARGETDLPVPPPVHVPATREHKED